MMHFSSDLVGRGRGGLNRSDIEEIVMFVTYFQLL